MFQRSYVTGRSCYNTRMYSSAFTKSRLIYSFWSCILVVDQCFLAVYKTSREQPFTPLALLALVFHILDIFYNFYFGSDPLIPLAFIFIHALFFRFWWFCPCFFNFNLHLLQGNLLLGYPFICFHLFLAMSTIGNPNIAFVDLANEMI